MTDQQATTKQIRPTRRHLRGVVISAGMAKTAVIKIDTRIPNPKYGKYFTSSKKFKVHDEHGKAHVGDVVEVEETRPLSKDKRWRFVKTIKAA